MSSSYRRTGCQVRGLLEIMREDQKDHLSGEYPETYAKFRSAVLEWMFEVCAYFKLHLTTAHAAAAYLDRLQPNERFSQKEWQLLAVCCVIISAKYNECEEHVPDLYTLEEITKQRLPNETVLNYELWILKKMGWRLSARTTMAFLSSYFVEGVVLPDERSSLRPDLSTSELAAAVRKQSEALAMAALLDGSFKGYKRSETASAAVLASRQMLGLRPLWTAHLTELTGSTSTDLSELSEKLMGKARTHQLQQQLEQQQTAEELDTSLSLDTVSLSLQSPVMKAKPSVAGISPTSVAESMAALSQLRSP